MARDVRMRSRGTVRASVMYACAVERPCEHRSHGSVSLRTTRSRAVSRMRSQSLLPYYCSSRLYKGTRGDPFVPTYISIALLIVPESSQIAWNETPAFPVGSNGSIRIFARLSTQNYQMYKLSLATTIKLKLCFFPVRGSTRFSCIVFINQFYCCSQDHAW